ncbi:MULTISPECIES: ABC transporter substrate-binding protein [unclassified Rhizobium]|uniref:ABC transporter substrate-binding protein n=1 Tax=unclassified Rhizobium TaxID=2613769 RepID=UPI001609DC25|nr:MULTISPECIES: ABC transporter substrate-binding protein [unclassified Rhizobium]MBB3287046.1 glucose/mannose transport system substrate-binding protein [Rhizobium sp. BK252]MBB3401786.1 glucose/mannose transport system substrate-binding protein [Rhizobium sp. BK289]MBB3414270.1 glucose/mannose transport system substrate-binding protein [Rhizobium sp. BK284]MBB3482157.1 glucose/mannose transport system substrate-binding protein [Rhizobium sp. BK347]MDK4718541.1 ABC transporter substrate-bind
MKNTMKLLMVGAALAAASAPAHAEDKAKAEVMTSWTSGSEAAALDVIKQEFEKRGGDWKDSSIAGFGAADAAFQNRLVAGDPPTAKQAVIGLANADFVSQGLLSPIDDLAKAGKWADILPKSIHDLITYNGQVYLSPTGAHGESWAFYSKDAFAKAGVNEEPKSWDEFFAALDKLKAAGVQPVAWGGQSWQEAKVFNMILLTQVGIDGFLKIYASKDKGDASVEGVKKTLDILGKLRGYVDEGAAGRNWNDATAMVITGKAGVQFMGDWAKGEFVAAGKQLGKDYGCMLVPQSPGMVYVADAFSFPKIADAASQKGQALLAEVAMDPAVQVAFSLKKGSVPMRTDVDKSKLDMCAQKGLELMGAGKIVPDQALILSPQQAGALNDFVDEFWSNPSEDSASGAEKFFGIFE